MDTNRHECKKRLPANLANSREKILVAHCYPSLRVHSRHSRANLLLFVSISVHSWLGCCLSARGQRRAQMPNFVFYIARIFDGLRDFLADEPAITTPQIVKLFFYRRLLYPQYPRKIVIRNICALRGEMNTQRLKQSEPPFASAFFTEMPKRLFDDCRSPAQIEQLLRRP